MDTGLEGRHESFWIATETGLEHPQLEGDLEVDAAIVGGGMVGILTAYLLAQRGKTVAILEADRIVRGVTGHTTAKITSQHNLIYDTLIKSLGEDRARRYAEANETAKEEIARLIAEHSIECSFTQAPAYTYTTSHDQVERVKREVDAARRLGLPASFTEETELPLEVAGAIRFDDQAHFHPRAFLLALAREAERMGVQIFEETRVTRYEEGDPCRVETESGTVTSRDIVIATNTPINDTKYFITRMEPIRAYGIAARIEKPILEGMYINTDRPTRSVRPAHHEGKDYLIIVGENHPVGNGEPTEPHYAALERFAKEDLKASSIDYRWSTQDFYPVDEIPYIGRLTPGSKHCYTATGLKGWGMTHSMVAAMIISDAIEGKDNPWREVYAPFRAERVLKNMASGKLWKQTGITIDAFALERIRKQAAADLEPGEGKVVESDGEKVAVFRDEHGEVHARSAVCSHMGCIIAWNSAEKSWDCPCHGSRFDTQGRVLHGPASSPLGKATQK